MKQMGARSAGNPHAACDVAGTGNVAWPRYCDTRKRKSEPTGNTNFDLNRRASPRPYREVKLIKETAAKAKQKPSDAVAIISYDEKPGRHATFARDHEYKRHGTVSLLAGIDLLTGKVHALVKDRHRSREFIEFL